MLTHRLQRWANIKPTLGKRLILAGMVVHRFEKNIADPARD